jgi:vacuolar-type H+-ATPase subunit I/STV1
MRIAVLIIGIVLGFIIMVQSFSAGVLGEVGNNDDISDAGAGGVWVAIFWIIASALAIAFPMASVVLFGFASAIAFGIAGTSDFEDMWVWGGIGILLAIFSFFGWRGKRKDRRERDVEKQRQVDRDDRLERLLAQRGNSGTSGETPTFTSCPSCGHQNSLGTKFCAECGQSLQAGTLSA